MEPAIPANPLVVALDRRVAPEDQALWEAKVWGALRMQWESVKALSARSGLSMQQTRRACRALHQRQQVECHRLPSASYQTARVFYRKQAGGTG